MTISEIVWDMDGTIVDSAESVPDAFISAVEELGGGKFDRATVLRHFLVGPPEMILASLLDRDLRPGEADVFLPATGGRASQALPGYYRRANHPSPIGQGDQRVFRVESSRCRDAIGCRRDQGGSSGRRR